MSMSAPIHPAVPDVAAHLTEAILPVVARFSPEPPSVEVELTLWHAMESALQTLPGREPAAYLTDAAYRAVLPMHPAGAFVDLELSLHRRIRHLAGAV